MLVTRRVTTAIAVNTCGSMECPAGVTSTAVFGFIGHYTRIGGGGELTGIQEAVDAKIVIAAALKPSFATAISC